MGRLGPRGDQVGEESTSLRPDRDGAEVLSQVCACEIPQRGPVHVEAFSIVVRNCRQSRVLRRWRDPLLDHQHRQKPLHRACTHVLRMALAEMKNEPLESSHVGPFRSQGVVLGSALSTNVAENAGCAGRAHRSGPYRRHNHLAPCGIRSIRVQFRLIRHGETQVHGARVVQGFRVHKTGGRHELPPLQ